MEDFHDFPNNSYDAAAWWQMQLCCDKCGVMLDYDLNSQHPIDSDAYWHEYGQRAKQAGWHILEKNPEKTEWTILCSKCVHGN